MHSNGLCVGLPGASRRCMMHGLLVYESTPLSHTCHGIRYPGHSPGTMRGQADKSYRSSRLVFCSTYSDVLPYWLKIIRTSDAGVYTMFLYIERFEHVPFWIEFKSHVFFNGLSQEWRNQSPRTFLSQCRRSQRWKEALDALDVAGSSDGFVCCRYSNDPLVFRMDSWGCLIGGF